MLMQWLGIGVLICLAFPVMTWALLQLSRIGGREDDMDAAGRGLLIVLEVCWAALVTAWLLADGWLRKALHTLLPERQIVALRASHIEAAKNETERIMLAARAQVLEKPQAVRTDDERMMVAKLEGDLTAAGRPPDNHLQPLLAVAANPFLAPARLYALGAAGAAFVGLTGFVIVEHKTAQHARQWKADNQTLRQDLTDRDARLKTLRVQVTDQNVQCVQDQIRAADVRAKQETRATAASIKARKRVHDASGASPAATFDLSAALDELRKPAGSASTAPTGGSPGADRLEGGVPPGPVADAGAADRGVAP